MKNIIKFLFITAIVNIMLSCVRRASDDVASEPTNFEVEYLTLNDTTGKLMNEDDFWKIIERSRVESNYEYQAQIRVTTRLLSKLSPNQIERFDNTFRALLAAFYDSKLWGAAYVINGGCSDDCFEYFREYLIAHGKYKFYTTLKDPESCAPWIKAEYQDNWEGLRYSAQYAYKQLTGKEMSYSFQPAYKLDGKLFDEDTVEEHYPKLAERF